jgi:hypothetical protein
LRKDDKWKNRKSISQKHIERMKELNKGNGEVVVKEDSDLVKWFKARMKMMRGSCAECNSLTNTKEYKYAINSIAHLVGKRKSVAPSVALHPLNWIELCENCHTQYDKSSWEEIELWDCWGTIKERLLMVANDITPNEERHLPDSVRKYIIENDPFPNETIPK